MTETAASGDAEGSVACDLSIVVPAYNESQRLPATLARIAEDLAERRLSCEVLVVDDGSGDDTAVCAERAASEHALVLRVLRHAPNRGKGYAVRSGMLAATGRAVLLMDADLSVPMEHLGAFLDELEEGAEVVCGSRRLHGARVEVHQSKQREWLGSVFRQLSSLLLVDGVSDFTCGFKLFRRDAAQAIFARQRLWGWGYDVEILFIARRLGLRVGEQPVSWFDDRRSRVRLWRDIPRSFADLVRIRWNAARGRYDEPSLAVDSFEVRGAP